MAYIPCPGGLSTMWKTKAEGYKWLKKVEKRPCGVSHCGGGEGCLHVSLLVRVKVKTGYIYNAQVFCYCPPARMPLGERDTIAWAPVEAPKKQTQTKPAKKRANLPAKQRKPERA